MKVKEKYYLKATEEFDAGDVEKALWSKAVAQSEGDEDKAKYRYIEERAARLHSENEGIFQIKKIEYLAFLPIVLTSLWILGFDNLKVEGFVGVTVVIILPTVLLTLLFERLIKDQMKLDESETTLIEYRSKFRFFCSVLASIIVIILLE